MKFIGIDFGWVSGDSGLCCLEWHNNKLKILELTTKAEITEILTWIDRHVSDNEPALIAVDAPTIIPNQTGTRLPDKLTHKYFGRYHAGCYPANLNRPFADRTTSFGLSLSARNFIHAPAIEAQKLGRYQIEVYPHPAIVNLFGLQKILKYKKGKLADRKTELIKLRDYIVNQLPLLEPSLAILDTETSLKNLVPIIDDKITGKELKAIEDRLDSSICAYVGAYWWYWGKSKNLVLGDVSTGYIVVPASLYH
ncbi:DUF429 domain-containing protein [Myxosarcina sp. GI1]|uniref:DUF429 domain-containing protein n=1 Tax=Myxosarcina sp. GI1 TaxID=1541065 RepID=UPI00055AF88D|nr:DUF429 domain-containing protein [Myxosarcina sp. GI1]